MTQVSRRLKVDQVLGYGKAAFDASQGTCPAILDQLARAVVRLGAQLGRARLLTLTATLNDLNVVLESH